MADMKLFNMRIKRAAGRGPATAPRCICRMEHIRALKMDTPLSHGTEVEFHGVGHVSDSSSHEDMEGEPRHSMTITLHRAGMEHESDEETPVGGCGRNWRIVWRQTTSAAGERCERLLHHNWP